MSKLNRLQSSYLRFIILVNKGSPAAFLHSGSEQRSAVKLAVMILTSLWIRFPAAWAVVIADVRMRVWDAVLKVTLFFALTTLIQQ